MDFKELQTETEELLNFTSGVTDQNFTTAQIKRAINRAYKREVRLAKQEGTSSWFKVVQEETWPSGDLTFELPTGITGKTLIRVYDRTDNDPGLPLEIADNGNASRTFWKDYKTLQWGSTTGPGSDKTLAFVYYADAADMAEDGDEPWLIPPENREVLYWSAALDLRLRADEIVPREWKEQHKDAQSDFWKKVSLGRPSDAPPTIRVVRSSDNTFVYYN